MSYDLLDVHGLKTYFYTPMGTIKAVDDFSIEIDEKEAVGLVGESGCGKSTVALSIIRLVPRPGRIVEGRIIYKQKNLLELTKEEMCSIRGKDISIVFQDPLTFLNPVMKIGAQIGEGISLHQTIEKRRVEEKVIDALKMVGIPSPSDVAEYYPHQLSGGMRQRVLIATALSCGPSLLIADEPTSYLDVTVQAQILELLREMKEKFGLSMLLITHDLGIVSEICDKVCVMYAGQLVEQADVFTLLEKPKHPYTMGLLESTLSIEKYKETLVTIGGDVPDLRKPPSGCRFHPRCPQAKRVCSKVSPKPVEISPKHIVSCWLYC